MIYFPQLDLPSIPVNMFTLEIVPLPAHSLLACLECCIGASVSISAVDSLPLERLAPGLVSSSVRVERSSFLSDGNANLLQLVYGKGSSVQ